ncbi:ribonuclease H-like domain-containing protein [Mycena epipterygia]|nr:ribonuclease H-like domain-containing protein [Mycena epipterygia]
MTKPYPMTDQICYPTTADQMDDVLAPILDGVIGFDTEFSDKKPTKEETIIDELFKKLAATETLCSIQIARANKVWVINLKKINTYPMELERILRSPEIVEVGIGLDSDVPHLWRDLRTDIKNMVEVGLMEKLVLTHKYSEQGYGNLSLQASVAEILGFYMSKSVHDSDWKGTYNKGQLTDSQITYAAINAAAFLRLYEALVPEDKQRKLRVSIPRNWYSMNSVYGELRKKYLTMRGEELAWSVKDCYWYSASKFQGYT